VSVWREDSPANWHRTVIQFEAVPWRVSFSGTGTILAVSCDDNSVSLFKEGLAGEWTKISQEQAEQ
jgi:protein transport protein SEC13